MLSGVVPSCLFLVVGAIPPPPPTSPLSTTKPWMEIPPGARTVNAQGGETWRSSSPAWDGTDWGVSFVGCGALAWLGGTGGAGAAVRRPAATWLGPFAVALGQRRVRFLHRSSSSALRNINSGCGSSYRPHIFKRGLILPAPGVPVNNQP